MTVLILSIALLLMPVQADAETLNPQGACCFCDAELSFTRCRFLSDELCDGLGGVFVGPGTSCIPDPCPAVCEVPVTLISFSVE